MGGRAKGKRGRKRRIESSNRKLKKSIIARYLIRIRGREKYRKIEM